VNTEAILLACQQSSDTGRQKEKIENGGIKIFTVNEFQKSFCKAEEMDN